MLKLYRPIILFSITLMLFAACNTTVEKESVEAVKQNPNTGINPYEKSDVTVEVFKGDSTEVNGNKGWGYNILVDGKIYVHQPNIPAIMGNSGFGSEEKAQKAGEFVVSKIKNNILPPSVTPEELDSLGVLN